jgi:hypothetical protein
MKASGYERWADDWYQEDAACVDALLAVERFDGLVWDPACGGGNIPERVIAGGGEAIGSDKVDRGYGEVPVDFLTRSRPALMAHARHIICNPPYCVIEEWIDRALDVVPGKVAILARLALLEGQKRKAWWKTKPLARVRVSARRLSMPPGGSGIKAKGGTVAFAWFVFDRSHVGAPVIDWI